MNPSVSSRAHIDTGVAIGPYTIIEDDVRVGTGTYIGSHVIIHNGSVIGKNNRLYDGVHIGVEPQDYHFKGESSQCIIGDNNIIREYTTVSRATGENKKTIIGNNNFIMTYVHVAHNDIVGSHVVIASSVQIGGYVEIGDYVNIGGLTGIHQFCMVGAYAMLGAQSYLNQDLLPCLMAQGNRIQLYNVNIRGLERNSFTPEQIEAIKDLYRPLLQSRIGLDPWLESVSHTPVPGTVKQEVISFVKRSRRGILLRTANRMH